MQNDNDKRKSGKIQNAEDKGSISSSKYPYGPISFLLGATVGQGYVASGLQSVLELYFVRFLFICSGTKRATSLSTTCVNVFIAVYQLCAISAGFLADKVIGNYLTQTLSVVMTTTGIFLLTFSTWQYSISQPDCCYGSGNTSVVAALGGEIEWSNCNCSELHKETLLQRATLHISPSVNIALALLGIMLYAVGYGHINTVQSVFVADQFKEESKAKKRSFSWYYLCCNLGALGGESGLPILRQSLGFVIAWFTLLGSTFFSTVLFLSGSCFYTIKKPEKPLTCCCRRENSKTALSTEAEERPLLQGKGQTAIPKSSSMLSWLRELLPFLGVFGPLIVFWAVFYQQNTTWVVQGTHMDCYIGHLHVPPDLMPSVNDFMVIIIIPTLEYLVYPHLEATMKIKILPLHKLIVGMTSAALSFLMSGLLEVYVRSYQFDDCHGNVSIAWQLPQLLFISIAEVMVCVTGLEFAYSQAPQQYRNTVTAMWFLSQALGTLLNAGVAQIHL